RFPATASLIRRNRDLKYTLFRYFQAQISLFFNNFPETQTRNLNQHPQLQGQRVLNIADDNNGCKRNSARFYEFEQKYGHRQAGICLISPFA
ncbi:hypothetical protein, partial [uncultured Victivallis sp.]|uniref:hypothetical protein n=1 Tax=uncultured Victivallis sp. TaxID=354118 RepID=UPI002584961A